MRKFLATFFINFAVLAALLGGANFANAAEKTEQGKTAKAGPVVCHPEALSAEDRAIGMVDPCAPKNYIYTPLKITQEHTKHDHSHIWSDEESKETDGVNIWENTAKVGTTEVTVSQAVGLALCSPSSCPVKVRFRNPGKPDVIKEGGMPCASGQYFFIRDNLEELLACEENYPLY